ncbi:MAG: Lrp/AsnC family transcriptional regulator [Candidatus Thorarchaeota archaeon]|jgi:DNA-binding Lrp family transcriptional regulator
MKEKVRAYVLMTIEIGKTDDVLEELRHIDEAVRIAVTTGEYDIVILVEVDSLEALYDITVRRMHKIAGIAETTTAVVEKMISI